MAGKPLVLGLWCLNLLWTVAIFATPLALPAGAVADLDGRANVVDHEWGHLPLAASVVYFLGDVNCHQMAARSWTVGGNQMPIDARMSAGFLAGILGIGLVFVLPTLPLVRDEAIQILPRRLRAAFDSPVKRKWAVVGLGAAATGPLLVDVLFQLLGVYESTNVRRAWTGGLFGLGVGYLVGVWFDSVMAVPAQDARGSASA